MTQANTVDLSSVFSGIKTAKGRIDANYIRDGRYWTAIRRIKCDKSRQGDVFVAIEQVVVKVLDNADGKGHRVGEEVTHMLMMRHDSFLGNIKAFIANVLDMPEAEIGEQEAMEICDDTQPLTNTVVEVKGRTVETKKGNPFTQVDYIREVPILEAANDMDPDAVAIAFPGNVLDQLIANAAEQSE